MQALDPETKRRVQRTASFTKAQIDHAEKIAHLMGMRNWNEWVRFLIDHDIKARKLDQYKSTK